jgi:DNA-binding phage protein
VTKAKPPLKLVEFDAARYLDDGEAIAEYMTAVLEANDPDLLLLALSDVTRAWCQAPLLISREGGTRT